MLALASRTITAAELAFMLNQNYSFICRMMARHPTVRRDCVDWRRDDVLKHWWTLVEGVQADREQPRRRRILPADLPEGHAEFAFDQLKASISCGS